VNVTHKPKEVSDIYQVIVAMKYGLMNITQPLNMLRGLYSIGNLSAPIPTCMC